MYYNITSILVFTLLLLCLAAVAASPQYKVTETVHEDELSTVHEDELSNNTIISRRGELRAARAPRPPCSCADGQCGCCTGFFLEQLNVNVRQRGCMNITYDPDEFAFGLTMRFNDRVLYQNTVSGKNPRPVCVPIGLSLVSDASFCVRFFDIEIRNTRNVYGCFRMYFKFSGETNDFRGPYLEDCFNIGLDGAWIQSLTTPTPENEPVGSSTLEPAVSSSSPQPPSSSSSSPDDYDSVDEVAS